MARRLFPSFCLSDLFRSIFAHSFRSPRSRRRLMSRSFHAIPALEQRQLLSGSTDISVYGDMGVHSAAISLPSGAQGFVGFTANPMSGAAYLDSNNWIQYTYNASGSTTNDSFTVAYVDGMGQTDNFTVNVNITGSPAPTESTGYGSGSGTGYSSGSASSGSSGTGYGAANGEGSGSGSESGSGGGEGEGSGSGSGSGSGTGSGSGSGTGSGSGSGTGSNSPPTAQDGYVYTIHDRVTTGTFSGQDWDYDLLSISVGSGSLGSLSLGSPYQSPWDSSTTLVDYTFTPNPGDSGSETLTLTVSDGEYSDDASVYVSVWNSPPTAQDGYVYTIHDQVTTGTFSGQDWDYDLLSISVSSSSLGSLSLGSPYQSPWDSSTTLVDYTFTPNPGDFGSETLTLTVSDGENSDDASVYVSVWNTVPEPSDDGTYTVQCHCDNDPTGNVASNDGLTQDGVAWKDSDGDTVTFVLVDDVSYGTLDFDTATGEFEYEQNEGFIGDDSFTYQITDGVGTSTTTATVALSVVGKTVPATPPTIQGTVTIDGVATSTAEKGMFTPRGETTERETTDEELVFSKYYFMQYDGPTEFTAEYTINLNADGTFNPTSSTVMLTTVNYTSRYNTLLEHDSLTDAQKAAYEAQGDTVYEEGGKFYILKKAKIEPSGWKTLSIPITEATIVNGRLHSFKFAANAWYGQGKEAIIDKGIVGEVDLAKCKAEFTAKYQTKSRGAIATYVTTGEIK